MQTGDVRKAAGARGENGGRSWKSGRRQGRNKAGRRAGAAEMRRGGRGYFIYIVTYFLKPKICSTNPSSNP